MPGGTECAESTGMNRKAWIRVTPLLLVAALGTMVSALIACGVAEEDTATGEGAFGYGYSSTSSSGGYSSSGWNGYGGYNGCYGYGYGGNGYSSSGWGGCNW